MSLVDQKMRKASSDLEAAFQQIPPPDVPEPRTSPFLEARATVLVVALVAIVGLSLSLLATGPQAAPQVVPPANEETPPPPEEEEETITVSEPEVPKLTGRAVEAGVFQPVLAGDEIFGVSWGIWIFDGDESWNYFEYEVVGVQPKGWIWEIDRLGDSYVGVYRTVVDDGEPGEPVDILIYSDDALTWYPGEVADTRPQPFWEMATGEDLALATAAWPGRPTEVWKSHDGRSWTLATTIADTTMHPGEIFHSDGRFYMTGHREGLANRDHLLWTSTDGVGWQTVPGPQNSEEGSWISMVETIDDTLVVLIAEGWREAVWALSDGEWTDVTPTGFRGVMIEQADPSGPLFLVGDGPHGVWWTLDGYNWSSEDLVNLGGGTFGPSGFSPAVSSGNMIVAMHTASTVSRGYWIGTLE